ncbi:unnamed protein product [Caenorhabditis angaria]|uniref:Uncharacterized protein n=1 Tax=Caenorhabditis angaria TaxID=860376 RepID=A0A9P1IJL5_9PELO|nr:unnamed protein product [Caenorhabditis angaria]
MINLSIFLIIPVVFSSPIQHLTDSSTTTEPSIFQEIEKPRTICYRFLHSLLNAAKSNDYSIFNVNFQGNIYVNNELDYTLSKEEFFQSFLYIPQSNSTIEDSFPPLNTTFGVYGSSQKYGQQKSDQAKIGPGGIGPCKKKSDQAKIGPGEIGPGGIEPGNKKSDQVKSDQAKIGPGKIGPGKIGPGGIGPGNKKSDQAKIGPGKIGPGGIGPGNKKSDQAKIGPVFLGAY